MWISVYKKELDENEFIFITEDSISTALSALAKHNEIDIIVIDEKIVDNINRLMHFISECLATGLPVMALSPIAEHRDLFKSKGCHMDGERFVMGKMVKAFFREEEK